MSNIRFSPSPGFILIKVQEEDQQEILTVQDLEKTPASQGVVVAVGGPRLHESGGFYEAHVKVGDVVVFKPYNIDSIMIDDEQHRIIPFDNVRGVMTNEK